MDERDSAILLGVYQGKSIQEIAEECRKSVSTIHGRMVWLRDQGYIEPWGARKARSKKLTHDGISWIMSQYNAHEEAGGDHGSLPA